MRSVVATWDDSAAVRMPVAVMAAAGLKVDDAVEISAEDGRIIIAPVREAATLDDLLAGVTTENLHGEVDFGAPVGREAI